MRADSRARPRGGTGVRRFLAFWSLALVGLLALVTACATAVAGSPAPAVTVLPSAPSPVPPSPVTSSAAGTTESTRAPVTPTTEQSDPTTQASPTTGDSSTEILTVVSTPDLSSPATTESPATTTSVSRLTVSSSSEHRGTATVTKDGILVSRGTAPVTIEIYAEPLCPPCGEFAAKNGPTIDNAIDNSELAVNYRTLVFLDPASASHTYSTRASAALYCAAKEAGTRPGLFQDYYAALFDPDNQPAENASKDLTDDQLAKLAAGVGAPQSVMSCIRAGTEVDTAAAADAAGQAALAEAGGSGTPTVTSRGQIVDHNQKGWLDDLLGG